MTLLWSMATQLQQPLELKRSRPRLVFTYCVAVTQRV